MFRNGRLSRYALILVVAALACSSSQLHAAMSLLPNFTIDLGGTSAINNSDDVTGIDTLDFVGVNRIIRDDFDPNSPAFSVGEELTVQGVLLIDSLLDGGFNFPGFGTPITSGAAADLNPSSPGAGGTWSSTSSGTGWEMTGTFETKVEITDVTTFADDNIEIRWKHDPTSASFLRIYLDGDGTGDLQADAVNGFGFADGILALNFTDTPGERGKYEFEPSGGGLIGLEGTDDAFFEYDDDPNDISGVFKNVDGDDITEPLDGESDPILKAVITSALLLEEISPPTDLVTNFNSIFGTPTKPSFFIEEDGLANLVPEASSYAIWGMLIVGGLVGNFTRRRRKSEGE